VHNRHKQALALGYHDFVEMSYYRMSRIGYGAKEVSAFRDAVKKYLVPLHTKLEEHRKVRLGLDHLSYYDSGIAFKNGNPTLIGDTAACLAATEEMYTQLSPETAEFIHHLMENDLYDVESRSGKCGGGFMMSLESYRSPFIFANFDGTSNDAYIMCHEGGHAFQYYLKRNDEIREHCWITSEIGESHAMSMELFTFPYMELFFGDRADDYRTRYLENTVWRILYQCEQDEFQQRVFEQPSFSCGQRNELWAQLERDYFPSKDLSGNEHLEMGRGWQHIQHTFLWPFYAIDYGLAQVVALEYYQWMLQDAPAAWESYLTFCEKTGELSFTELAKASGIASPFDSETIRSLAKWLEELLK
jgi:M3 family oligoendopeptidase